MEWSSSSEYLFTFFTVFPKILQHFNVMCIWFTAINLTKLSETGYVSSWKQVNIGFHSRIYLTWQVVF